MKFLMVGHNPISVLYGWTLSQAGHQVEMMAMGSTPAQIELEIFDARKDHKGILVQNDWKPRYREALENDHDFEWIVISVSANQIESSVQKIAGSLAQANVLFFSPCWEDPAIFEALLPSGRCVWGAPVGAGLWATDASLTASLMPTVHLGAVSDFPEEKLNALSRTFSGAGFHPRLHTGMKTWLWISFALNAGLASQALQLSRLIPSGSLTEAFDLLLGSVRNLRKAVLAIREALGVVKARGVSLSAYKSEVGPYSYPAWFAAFVLQTILKKNEPALRIMKMSGGFEELTDTLNEVTATAGKLSLPLKALTVSL